MLNIILACIATALGVVCIAVAISKERRKDRQAFVDRLTQEPEYDETRMLRNRSERSEDW